MSAAAAETRGRIALFLPSLAGGGAEKVFVDLANRFSKSGIRIDLLLAAATGPYLGDVRGDVRVIDLGCSRVLSAVPGIVKHLRRERPAALLSGLDHANVAALLAHKVSAMQTRSVISLRAVPSDMYRNAAGARSRILPRAMRIAYRHADAIIANSHTVAVDAARLLGLDGGNIRVIGNPVDVESIAALGLEPPGHGWFAPEAPPVVVAVGSLTPVKNFGALIRAFAIARARRTCRLAILGEGPERHALESLADRLGVSDDVILPGFQRNPFGWMSRAAVVASSSRSEGCPNALLQAVALGRPVVATDVPGSAEVLENGRWGELVAAESPDSMAAAILAALESGRGVDGAGFAARHSPERIEREYLDVLLPQGPGR